MDALDLDPLTGFLSRSGCLLATMRLIEFCRRQEQALAALWLDLDRFKQVNESFGHAGGDAIIARVASRLASAFAGRVEFCRMGGDEFVFLVPGCDRRRAEELAVEILRAVSEPIEAGTIRLRPSASVGVAVLEPDDEPLPFLERADRAMVEAKRLGGGRHVVSGDERVPGRLGVLLAREELATESQIHAALETGGLSLHYQPILTVGGRVEAVEALMRCHVQGESVPPGKIIPVAEKTGLIVRLGEWSMLDAARFAHRLRGLGLPTKVAVNVSRAQLTAPKFIEALNAAIICADVAPALIELEVTESLFMDISDVVQSNLAAVRETGVSVAIDDFGTGYSCLATLKDIPAGKLKLDRAFVTVLPSDKRALAVVKAVAQMGRELGMTVVAEGVETREQLDILTGLGLEAIQGFFHARPMAEGDLIRWLENHS